MTNYRLAYEIMLLSHGGVDSQDAMDISNTVAAGEAVDWSHYSESTIDALKHLFTTD
jgi:hypothetical protein